MAEEPEADQPDLNTSHDLDLVPVFSSSNYDAEMQAMTIHSILQANGLPSVFVGDPVIPSLEFQVQVPRALVPDAQKILEEARQAGPAAAAEAEAASEEEG
jgi:hypothetical protein